MDKPIYVVGHRSPDTDSICSAIAYAQLKQSLGHKAVRPARAGAIDAESAFVLRRFDLPEPELLTDAAGLDLILVDHNEVGQALPNIAQANILEIWEHHRIGDLRLPKPIVFHCEPVGATATLIAEQFFARGVEPSPTIAGILIAAILSDSVRLRSPTTSAQDHAMVARLQPLAGLDLQAFGAQLREVKTAAVAGKSAAQIVGDDFKAFDFAGQRVGIAQVEVEDASALATRAEAIRRQMQAMVGSHGLALMVLMVTEVGAEASDLWAVGARMDLFEQAFGAGGDGTVHLPGCMSRKKQVVPPLEAAFGGAVGLAT